MSLREEIERRVSSGNVLQHVEEFAGHEIRSYGSQLYVIHAAGIAGFLRNGQEQNPNVLVAHSLLELRRRVLQAHGVNIAGDVLATCEGYALTQSNGNVFAFPLHMQGVEHLPEADRAAAGVIRGNTRGEVEHTIHNQPPLRQVEFAGWLPAFRLFGNCGRHPQFGHIDVPPPGYKFIKSPPPVVRGMGGPKRLVGKAIRRFKVHLAQVRLFSRCLAGGASARETIDFLRTRDTTSQLALPRRNRLLFLTSVPFTLGQDPMDHRDRGPRNSAVPIRCQRANGRPERGGTARISRGQGAVGDAQLPRYHYARSSHRRRDSKIVSE